MSPAPMCLIISVSLMTRAGSALKIHNEYMREKGVCHRTLCFVYEVRVCGDGGAGAVQVT